MASPIYRYTFAANVPPEDIECALVLAAHAVESLHGESQVRLDAGYLLDPEKRTCVVDASTPVGRDFNRLFVGFLNRELGEDAFQVERVPEHSQETTA